LAYVGLDSYRSIRKLIFQIKVKLFAGLAGLASVGFEGKQLVLRYPSLPEGIKTRNLPELGGQITAGKNAYRIHFNDPDKESWQGTLVKVLYRIRKLSAY